MSGVLTVIPARLGSTRFPGKVLARLKGKTMVEWCWRAAKAANLGPILVATDDRTVADEVRRFGGAAVMTPKSCPSGSDRVWLAAKNHREAVILNYQGDMPLLKPATLRAAVKALTGDADIATAVIPLNDRKRRQDPNVVKVALTKKGRCLYFSRSNIPFGRDGARVQSLGAPRASTFFAATRSAASSRFPLLRSRRARSLNSFGRWKTE